MDDSDSDDVEVAEESTATTPNGKRKPRDERPAKRTRINGATGGGAGGSSGGNTDDVIVIDD